MDVGNLICSDCVHRDMELSGFHSNVRPLQVVTAVATELDSNG